MNDELCPFCKELQFGFEKKYYNDSNEKFEHSRILTETDHWVVIPTLGSFIEGYILIINKHHYRSLYDCPLNQKNELLNLMKSIEILFEKVYGKNNIFFEHGTISGPVSTNSVEHVHIHMLPFNNILWPQIQYKYNFNFFETNTIVDIDSIIVKQKLNSYILFGDTNNQVYLIDSTHNNYPPQFMRRILSDYFCKAEQWNWKEHYFIDNMLKTYKSLFKDFK